MKPTREQIIETGLQIVSDIYRESYDTETASATEGKVKLYALGNEGYYEGEGWHFSVNSRQQDHHEPTSFLVYFLGDGTPLQMSSFLGDDKPRLIYCMKDKNSTYTVVSEEEYFRHQHFDFEKLVRKKF